MSKEKAPQHTEEVNLRGLEIRHLRYFLAVAEELHFRHAAEKLHISQPPLSQQIRYLEDYLGVSLFRRDNRNVELTHSGKVFLEEVRGSLARLERAVNIVKRADRGASGTIVVGHTDDFIYGSLPEILAKFQKQYPDVMIRNLMGASPSLASKVVNGELDAAFVCLPLPNKATPRNCLILPSSRLIAVLPEGHSMATLDRINIRDLSDEYFLLMPRSPWTGFYSQIGRMFDDAGFVPKIRYEGQPAEMLLEMVSQGLGIAIVSEGSVNLKRKGIIWKEIDSTNPRVETALVWSQEDSSPILTNFVENVRAIYQLPSRD